MTASKLIQQLAAHLPVDIKSDIHRSLIKLAEGDPDPEVTICDLANDDDEKYHFVEIDDVSEVKIRRNEFVSIFFNKDRA